MVGSAAEILSLWPSGLYISGSVIAYARLIGHMGRQARKIIYAILMRRNYMTRPIFR